MTDKKGESGKYIALGLLIGALAALASVYVPYASLAAPAFLAFVFAAWGTAGIVSALTGALAASLLTLDVADAAYTLSLYLPASLIMGWVIRENKPWRAAVSASALAMGVALYLNMSLPYMLEGSNPFEAVQKAIGALASQMSAEMQALYPADTQGLQLIKETFASIEEIAPQLMMYLVCGLAMLFALIDVVIARTLLKKTGTTLRPMTHFALWQLGGHYVHVTLAAIAGTAAVFILGLDNADAVFAAASGIVMMPLMLMGVCYMEFTLRMSPKKSAGRRVAFYIFTVFLLPYSLIFLGLADRFTKVRRHYTTKKKTDGE